MGGTLNESMCYQCYLCCLQSLALVCTCAAHPIPVSKNKLLRSFAARRYIIRHTDVIAAYGGIG
jgi:hypothetical protein